MEDRLPEGRKNLKRKWQGLQNITKISFIMNNIAYDLMKYIFIYTDKN